jgi:predicted kinase
MNKPMWKVIIMCGVPGSGKSYLAKQLAEQHRHQISDYVATVSADHYWERPDGIYDWNFKYIANAHKWCQTKFGWYVAEGYDLVIVDNTNLSAKERKPYIDMAKAAGYEISLRESETEWRYNADECFKRNTHGVPLDTINTMLAKLAKDKFDGNFNVDG